MKVSLKQLRSTPILVLMLFVALFSAFEILVTWNSGIDRNYPGYTFGITSTFIISAFYIVWYFRRVAV
jgi:hypothetical protein